MLLPFKRFWVTSGLNTTMIYVHVDKTHIEQAWAAAGRRAIDRFGGRHLQVLQPGS